MIKPIVIKVTDKVPELVSGPEYVVCDNSDYTVVWQLDEEWAQFEHRTMQVNYKDGTYERVLFTGDSCALTAIPVPGSVHVGLFAGDIHTTRPARLLAVRSATTDSGEERDPTPDGYAQAIQALDGKLDKNQGADNAGKALVVDEEGNVVPGKAQGGSLPAMSADTKGKALFNDGEKAEWGGAVRYDGKQSLTDVQMAQARENIDSFPHKILPYFFDTSESSTHDNDVMWARFGDVINPGNIYTDDGGHTNEGMVFPAFVTRTENPALHIYLVYLLDASGQSWQIAKNIYDGTDGKTHYLFYDISNITPKGTMCVNFTQYSSSNWSADKNWNDAAALIESGGLVYAVHNNRVFSCIDHIPKNAPPPINGRIIFGSVTSGIFSPPSINRIDIKNISWYSNGIAYVDDYSKDLVQADWDEQNEDAPGYIRNKPSLNGVEIVSGDGENTEICGVLTNTMTVNEAREMLIHNAVRLVYRTNRPLGWDLTELGTGDQGELVVWWFNPLGGTAMSDVWTPIPFKPSSTNTNTNTSTSTST